MGTQTVISQQGDTVDALAHRHLNQRGGLTQQIYNLNPGLAALGNVLPTGTAVIIPTADTVQQHVAQNVTLWTT